MTIWALRLPVANGYPAVLEAGGPVQRTIGAVAASAFDAKCRNGDLGITGGGPPGKSVESSFSLDPESATI